MSSLGLFILLSFLAVAATADAGGTGQYNPITNLTDKHVIGVAEFAITEYNRQSGSNLELEKVVQGYSQIVAGTNYRLVMTAKNHGASKSNKYQTYVFESLSNNKPSLTLNSFTPLLGN